MSVYTACTLVLFTMAACCSGVSCSTYTQVVILGRTFEWAVSAVFTGQSTRKTRPRHMYNETTVHILHLVENPVQAVHLLYQACCVNVAFNIVRNLADCTHQNGIAALHRNCCGPCACLRARGMLLFCGKGAEAVLTPAANPVKTVLYVYEQEDPAFLSWEHSAVTSLESAVLFSRMM